MNLPGFSALPGFKAPFHGDGQSALNPGSTVFVLRLDLGSCVVLHFVIINVIDVSVIA